MDWYRLRLTLAGATGSLWQADTIFGHLCWALRYQAGEAALRTFLDRCRAGDPPLLVSNGFPDGWLPRPLHARPVGIGGQTESLEPARAAFRATRRARKIEIVSIEDFRAIQRGEAWQPAPAALDPPCSVTRVALKNQIDRLAGTTGAGGELFGFVEHWPPVTAAAEYLPITIYCRVAPDFVDDAELLVLTLAESGYGKRRSAGYGRIRTAEFEPFAGFPAPAGANAFVSLSNFVPAAGDPTDGLWRSFVKYGRLGEELAVGPNPFKRPLIMFRAGAVFRDQPVREVYGRLVAGVSETHPEVVQSGYALAVPIVWPAEAP